MPADIITMLEQDCAPEVAQAFLTLATDYLAATRDPNMRVSTDKTRGQLAQRFAEPLPTTGRAVDEIVAQLRDQVIPDCNHLYHPRYVGHQVSAPLPAAIWTEALTAALNQSLAVWEMSPVGTVVEHQVVRWLCGLAGFGPGSGGTLTTGGTEATLTALLAARARMCPDAWTSGLPHPAPVLICGEHAHYATTRSAGILGLGMANVRKVSSRDYSLDVTALRSILDEEPNIMAIVATAGSTSTGSFDDLEAIGALAEERGIWLHVDAAHGGAALMSAAHRHRLAGLERANSVAIDPHKMMLLPLQAGTVLMRDAGDLDRAFAQQAPYLFHGSEDDELVDLGTRSLLCSRRADVFKVWVALQRYGSSGIGALYDHLCETTRALYDAVCRHPTFEAIHEPSSNILCFRHEGSDELNRELRERYNRSGHGWITTTMLDGRRVLRATIMNPRTTAADVREILERVSDQS
ncbi:MAG TPA: aminotransferase class V-fold PLP-dependent enzyme [Gemmatimonadaceae bacterium]|nr:aminotransferase class V-fold PLP-dependent enzyme [Gemmatimonadaceae bacterium]